MLTALVLMVFGPGVEADTYGTFQTVRDDSANQRRPVNVSPDRRAVLYRSKLIPHRISLEGGRAFELNLPEGFAISVAAQGLKRVRFMAKSPDHRIFVTDMYNTKLQNKIRLSFPTNIVHSAAYGRFQPYF
jgi:hypothetical protein